MGDPTMLAPVENRVVGFQSRCNVVGIEDRHFGCQGQAAAAHHGNIGVGDGQNRRAAPRGRRHRPFRRAATHTGHHRMVGQIGRQMGRHTDRPHAGTATAVGDAKGLV